MEGLFYHGSPGATLAPAPHTQEETVSSASPARRILALPARPTLVVALLLLCGGVGANAAPAPSSESDPKASGFFAFDVTKAQESGLKFRSLEEIVEDTLAWLKTRPADHHRRAGMKPERR